MNHSFCGVFSPLKTISVTTTLIDPLLIVEPKKETIEDKGCNLIKKREKTNNSISSHSKTSFT